MQTTEVFVEQVLIGLLVLFTGGLLVDWNPEIYGNAKDIQISILILGTSYLVGILYDRVADTLLQNLEQHYRLAIAIKRVDDHEVKGPECGADPFPEAQLRISIMRGGPGLAEYAGYLRSRIRLSRAMVSILPALSIGFAVHLLRPKIPQAFAVRYAWLPVAIVYASVFVLILLNIPEELPKTNEATKDEKDTKWRWPSLHLSRKGFNAYRDYKQKHSRKSVSWQWQIATREPTVWGLCSYSLSTWCLGHQAEAYGLSLAN